MFALALSCPGGRVHQRPHGGGTTPAEDAGGCRAPAPPCDLERPRPQSTCLKTGHSCLFLPENHCSQEEGPAGGAPQSALDRNPVTDRGPRRQRPSARPEAQSECAATGRSWVRVRRGGGQEGGVTCVAASADWLEPGAPWPRPSAYLTPLGPREQRAHGGLRLEGPERRR